MQGTRVECALGASTLSIETGRLAKQADGKSRKEAMRCLKRRISDAVYRQLRADLND